jgi:hypothetical protein
MDVFHEFLGKVEAAIINPLITLMGLAAFVVFLWGVVQFILALQGGSVAAAGENKSNPGIATGKRHMVWGLIGMVIMFGARAIVAIVAHTFGIDLPKGI